MQALPRANCAVAWKVRFSLAFAGLRFATLPMIDRVVSANPSRFLEHLETVHRSTRALMAMLSASDMEELENLILDE